MKGKLVKGKLELVKGKLKKRTEKGRLVKGNKRLLFRTVYQNFRNLEFRYIKHIMDFFIVQS